MTAHISTATEHLKKKYLHMRYPILCLQHILQIDIFTPYFIGKGMACHSVNSVSITTPHCTPWIWDSVSFTLPCPREYLEIAYMKREMKFLNKIHVRTQEMKHKMFLNICRSCRQ